MKTSIEFYIPIEKLTQYLSGGVVLYSSIAANGLIKIVERPENIVYVRRDQSLYYIRKSTFREHFNIKHKRKLK